MLMNCADSRDKRNKATAVPSNTLNTLLCKGSDLPTPCQAFLYHHLLFLY